MAPQASVTDVFWVASPKECEVRDFFTEICVVLIDVANGLACVVRVVPAQCDRRIERRSFCPVSQKSEPYTVFFAPETNKKATPTTFFEPLGAEMGNPYSVLGPRKQKKTTLIAFWSARETRNEPLRRLGPGSKKTTTCYYNPFFSSTCAVRCFWNPGELILPNMQPHSVFCATEVKENSLLY